MTIDIKYDILMKSMKIFSPKGKNIMLELVNVSYYKAPKTRISPIIIQNGYEYVEILTGGKLLFENEGQEEVFEYGTMFWHIPGDHTIHKYLPDFPYECLCLRFKRPNKSTERIFPRVAIWENREEVLSFSDKVINAFHDESFNHQLISQYVFSKISWEAALFMKRKSSSDIPASLAKLTSLIETAYTEDLTIEIERNGIGKFQVLGRGQCPPGVFLRRKVQINNGAMLRQVEPPLPAPDLFELRFGKLALFEQEITRFLLDCTRLPVHWIGITISFFTFRSTILVCAA